jgi:hypothetical protein
MSFMAALVTLIAFAIDIALYAYVKHQMKKLNGVRSITRTAPGQHIPHWHRMSNVSE